MRAVNLVEKLPDFFGTVFSSVMAYMQKLGKVLSDMPFSAYTNLYMSALDVEAGFPVSRALPRKEKINASIIPGGKYISTLHIGNYDSIQPAYDALTEWAKQNSY